MKIEYQGPLGTTIGVTTTTPIPMASVPYSPDITPVIASSGNVAAATATATITSASGKTAYITGFSVTGTGATVALPVSVTVTGVLGGTLTYTYAAIAGALLSNQPLVVAFDPPLPASATNTNIVVSCPSLGVGATNNTVVAQGYRL